LLLHLSYANPLITAGLILALIIATALALVSGVLARAWMHERAALVQLTGEFEARIAAAVAEREAAVIQTKRLKRLRALAQVASGVAHEFNNILQAVVGALEIIRRHPDDSTSVVRMVDLALAAAARGGIITRRLLGFANRAPLHATAADIAAMLTALCDPLSDILGTPITLSLQPDLPRVLIDRDELEVALVNLTSNARDAMPGGGTLAISATVVTLNGSGRPRATLAAGQYLCIAVKDTGTGMTPDILARATEPFFTTKPFGAGTGLGLSMAKGFAEQSGGGLTVESAPGVGTTVTVWLRVSDDVSIHAPTGATQ
jgi:signal transduction histidine kinase